MSREMPVKKTKEEFTMEHFALPQNSRGIFFEAGCNVLLDRLLLSHLPHFASKYVIDTFIAG